MPAKLRAGAGLPYVLNGDIDICEEPQFLINVLSSAESVEINDAIDSYRTLKDNTAKREAISRAVKIAVKECLIPELADCKDLTQELTDAECWELVAQSVAGAVLSAEERKKFASRHLSGAALSASDAAVGSADQESAKTSTPKSNVQSATDSDATFAKTESSS